ncbi:hypothetical protein TrRE_jg1854 [Triparma retinervis]|uniref:Phosphoglucomutase n=1 Tax=Triparma retinervis TaxID=2557542 RepID=A0A9W7CD35_9STRA|nr:hypothetical protein TrRE_jg1854 [Triparma retinervis]
MFYAVTTSKYDASVMVTASHLPAHKNGYKIFVRDSKYKARCLEKGEVKALLEDADVDNDYSEDEKDDRDDVTIPTLQTVLDFVPIYQSQLIETFRKRTCRIRPLKKLKVMLSTGHGSGFIVSRAFQELGANVVELNAEPDGTFPFGPPNPESKSMMKRTIKRCEEIGDVDLAVLLDTDGDRCGIVLRSGGTYKEVNRNRLIALCSQIVLEKDGDSNAKIITDSVTSIGLESFISRAGGTQLRFKKGYLNVINEAKRRSALGEEIPLAMETSGHGAFKENNYCDDGTYTALLVACFIADNNNGKGVIEDFEDAGYEEELRMAVKESYDKTNLYEQIALAVTKDATSIEGWELDPLNKEGIRVTTHTRDGFFMIRESLHDPIISMQIEAPSPRLGREVVAMVRQIVQAALDGGDQKLDFKELDSVVNEDGAEVGW